MKLADWLKQNRIKRNDFAERIGVSPQLITGYCNGSFWPGKENAQRILEATKGAVTPTDFLGEAAQAEPAE